MLFLHDLPGELHAVHEALVLMYALLCIGPGDASHVLYPLCIVLIVVRDAHCVVLI
jgi:hypothetical protein